MQSRPPFGRYFDFFSSVCLTSLAIYSARYATRLDLSLAVLTTQPLYSSANRASREEVTLEEVQDNLENIRLSDVFDRDGNPIQIYEPLFTDAHDDCGVLLNLDQVPNQVRPADEDQNQAKYTTFPLAFCKGIGNCQASTHLSFYQPFVDRVNSELRDQEEGPFVPPVACGPHQIYNEIAHKTRARDGLHDSQRGYVTAAMSGKCLRGADLRATHLRSQVRCEHELPSQSYKEKLLSTGYYIGLRFEPTVTINVQVLPENCKNGR